MKTVILMAMMTSILFLTGCSPVTTPTTPTTGGLTGSNDPMVASGEDTMPPIEVAEDLYDLTMITIQANGTEPFWSFVVSGSTLTWSEPTNSGTIATTPYSIVMSQTGTTITLVDTSINAVLTLQPCSDGMSDTVYSHEAVVTKGTETFNGCATITP